MCSFQVNWHFEEIQSPPLQLACDFLTGVRRSQMGEPQIIVVGGFTSDSFKPPQIVPTRRTNRTQVYSIDSREWFEGDALDS